MHSNGSCSWINSELTGTLLSRVVSVGVLQRNRINRIKNYLGIGVGIGSHGYGGWEAPRSAVCKLETREGSGIRPRVWWWVSWFSRQEKKTTLPFCSAGASTIGWHPSTLVRGKLLYSAYYFNAYLFQEHPHRHTQKLCLTGYVGIPYPNQVDT